MQRRDFVKMLGGTAAMASVPGLMSVRSSHGASHARPNIFMIFTDDTPKRDHGCYGNSIVRTPNVDRLASEGMTFNNVCTPAPMCGPSRAAIHTGLYPIRNGAHPNHSSCKPGTKSMAHYMQSLGYRVIILGKQHVKPEESFPFEEYDRVLGLDGPGEDIKRILADPGDKPLCVMMCHFETHWDYRRGANEYPYDPNEVEMPPYLVDTPETRAMRARYYSEIEFMDTAVGRVLQMLRENNMEENTLTIYASDHGSHWPHEKWNLYDAGINVPFIARWPGKIKPGTVSDALVSLVDIVPTFIDAGGGDVDRVVSECGGAPLDGKSFLPVLLGRKKDHHDAIFGAMTFGVITAYSTRALRTKTHKYIWNIDSRFEFPDYWATNLPATQREWAVWNSWVKKSATDPVAARRIRDHLHRPPVELYDLQKDPHEINNIADDPANTELLASLRETLDAWMAQQGDDGSSDYHLEEGVETKHYDQVWCRQEVVNFDIKPAAPGIAFWDRATVSLSSPIWAATIHYTLDGSDPTRDSPRFTGPFSVDPPLVIKAKGFHDDGETPVRTIDFRETGFRLHYNYWRYNQSMGGFESRHRTESHISL